MGLLFGVFMGWLLQYMKFWLSVNTHSGFILQLNNSVDPGQLACKEASWSGSTLFIKRGYRILEMLSAKWA